MTIKVKIIPRSSANKVEKLPGSDNDYKIRLTAPPVDNKANQALIRLLSEYFDVPKQSISILKGATKRQKLIEVMGK